MSNGASILENLFKKLGKDADGFDNVDDFFDCASVLKYPLSKPIESYLTQCSDEYMKALTGNKYSAAETDPGNSTDDDFDYEDNNSFTDASDGESLVSDDDTQPEVDVSIALTPETRKTGRSSVSTAASKSTLNESLPLEDTVNTTLNSVSRRTSRGNYSADVSQNNISAISAVTTPGKKGTSAKGRGRSSVGLNDSGTTAQPNSSIDEEPSSPEMSKSLNTTAVSGRSSNRSSSRQLRSDSEEEVSSENNSMVTPVSKSTRGNRTAPSTIGSNLSAPFSAAGATAQGGRTPGSRRVSFGNMPNLSPIGKGTPAGGSSGKKSRPSIGSINDPSTDMSSATAASEASGHDNDYYDNDDNMYFDEQHDGEEQDDRMTSMVSSVQTPQSTSKSMSRSSVGRSNNNTTVQSTPASAGKSSANTSRVSSANRSGGSSALRTPDSLHLSMIDTPKTGELYRGITLPDDSYIPEDEDTDREEDASNLNTTRDTLNESYAQDESTLVNETILYTISEKNPNYFGNKEEAKVVLAKKSTAVSSKHKRKVYTSDEDDAGNDLGINSEDSDDDGGKRRSKRVTKGQKFAFWKGERPIYEHGTLVGINAAAKTPVKPKSKSRLTHQGADRKRKRSLLRDVDGEGSDDELQQDEEEEVKPKLKESKIKLSKDLKYVSREDFASVHTWNEVEQDVVDAQVVRRVEEFTPKELKPSKPRPGGKNVCCLAVQALSHDELPNGQMSAWVSGHVVLPPRAIKDEEMVGKFNMIFALSECQNDAVELAIANPESTDWDSKSAQRMMLRKGDTFHIPPGNIYRLENHSSTIEARLYFTIIKPIENVPAINNSREAEAVY